MIILGVIALILGFVLGIHWLWIVGIILAAIGVVFLIAGMTHHEIGGRSHWY